MNATSAAATAEGADARRLRWPSTAASRCARRRCRRGWRWATPRRRWSTGCWSTIASGRSTPATRACSRSATRTLFVEMMGGGYADAVATGTASLYVALAALDLPKGSEVLVSPITDPGSLAAIVLNGLKPRLMDSMPGSYNVGPEQFAARITPDVTARRDRACRGPGRPSRQDRRDRARARHQGAGGLRQAHFAKLRGTARRHFRRHRRLLHHVPQGAHDRARPAASSTPVISRCSARALAHADRGKPRWREDFRRSRSRQLSVPGAQPQHRRDFLRDRHRVAVARDADHRRAPGLRVRFGGAADRRLEGVQALSVHARQPRRSSIR